MTKAKLFAIIDAIIRLRNTATDETALESVDIYPEWQTETSYRADGDHVDRVAYEGKLYKCVQSHVSQDGWSPDLTPALWTRVSIEEWPEWVQPTGAQDGYELGSRVSHNGKHWESTFNGINVWEPGVVGDNFWIEIL